jgi:holo-[acyl-carrier protein] synthase
MIFGIGLDIEDIARIEALVSRHKNLGRVFGKEELALLEGGPSASFASNFCAKEAFSKALGTGVRSFALKEVQLLRDEFGKPFIKLSGKAQELLGKDRIVHVSTSHTKATAAAFVIIERR